MIKTAVGSGGKWKFDAVAAKLKEHRVKIHLSDNARPAFRRHGSESTRSTFRRPRTRDDARPTYRRQHDDSARSAYRRQHIAHLSVDAGDYDDCHHSAEDTAAEEDEDPQCYVCQSCGPDEDFEDIGDRIEQDIMTCFLAAGADVEDKEHAEELSKAVHDELFAFYSRQNAQGMGARTQKRIHNYKPAVSELSIEQRRL